MSHQACVQKQHLRIVVYAGAEEQQPEPDLEQGPDQAPFLPERPAEDDPYWEEYRRGIVQRCAAHCSFSHV